MFEIIPNWHPIFVHFTVALLSLSVGLTIVIPFIKSPLKDQWQIVARWALWFGAGFTVITGLTGLYAYNTVAHDSPSHLAMTDHRNWAIVTIISFLALAGWSIHWFRQNRTLGKVFIYCIAVSGMLLGSTAWHGAEVVYRYGVGVKSLPKADTHQHEGGTHEHPSDQDQHSGSQHHDELSDKALDFSGMEDMEMDDGHDHKH